MVCINTTGSERFREFDIWNGFECIRKRKRNLRKRLRHPIMLGQLKMDRLCLSFDWIRFPKGSTGLIKNGRRNYFSIIIYSIETFVCFLLMNEFHAMERILQSNRFLIALHNFLVLLLLFLDFPNPFRFRESPRLMAGINRTEIVGKASVIFKNYQRSCWLRNKPTRIHHEGSYPPCCYCW